VPVVNAGSRQREETAADKRLYVELGFSPIRCSTCGLEALVKKNSQKHTSVQWPAGGVSACPEIGARRAADPNALILACPRLQASIEDAVRDGLVVIPDA
jgi:hypothetical protein